MTAKPTTPPRMPKGRPTIRRSGSLTGLHGPTSRPIKLWGFDAQPNTTLAQLERAYFAGLDAVDRIEERTRSNAASGKFTAAGIKDDALKFALGDVVPALHKARQIIKKAKAEASERRSKLKLEGPDKLDAAAAVRRAEWIRLAGVLYRLGLVTTAGRADVSGILSGVWSMDHCGACAARAGT
jgi:hypothetical protein